MKTPNFDIVTPAWIKEQLKKHAMTQVHLAKMIDMTRYRLNAIINDRHEKGFMGKSTRAAIWYFFTLHNLIVNEDLTEEGMKAANKAIKH